MLPVLVWIHGGRFLVGTGSSKVYSPDFMMDYEDIIVVSIQYRLGPLGFLSTEDESAPGNYGFHDQVSRNHVSRLDLCTMGVKSQDLSTK